jgi:hypothetical protein
LRVVDLAGEIFEAFDRRSKETEDMLAAPPEPESKFGAVRFRDLDLPGPEELAAAVKSGQAAMAVQKSAQTIGSVNKQKNFDSSHLDWSTDPPTATKW